MDYWNGRKALRERSVWKGAVAGAVGGFVASWTMNQFQKLWSKASEAMRPEDARKGRQSEEEDTTVKTAEIIMEKVAGRKLRKDEKPKAGAVVHYGFGILMGAVYGAAAEYAPQVTSAWGAAYGTAVFVGADEAALPLLGLSKSPTEYPASVHAYAAASHIVYGVTLESVRRPIRAMM